MQSRIRSAAGLRIRPFRRLRLRSRLCPCLCPHARLCKVCYGVTYVLVAVLLCETVTDCLVLHATARALLGLAGLSPLSFVASVASKLRRTLAHRQRQNTPRLEIRYDRCSGRAKALMFLSEKVEHPRSGTWRQCACEMTAERHGSFSCSSCRGSREMTGGWEKLGDGGGSWESTERDKLWTFVFGCRLDDDTFYALPLPKELAKGGATAYQVPKQATHDQYRVSMPALLQQQTGPRGGRSYTGLEGRGRWHRQERVGAGRHDARLSYRAFLAHRRRPTTGPAHNLQLLRARVQPGRQADTEQAGGPMPGSQANRCLNKASSGGSSSVVGRTAGVGCCRCRHTGRHSSYL